MEPVSIVGLAASCATLTKILLAVGDGLDSFRHSDTSVMGLVSRIRTVKYGLTRIERWCQEKKIVDAALLSCLDGSIRDFAILFQNIDARVKEGELKTWDKLKTVWNASIISSYETSLRDQIAALHFLLDIVQMTDVASQHEKLRDNDSKTILSKANRAASIYSASTDSAYGSEEREFAFDDEVINSRIYRAAWAKQAARSPESGSSTSIPIRQTSSAPSQVMASSETFQAPAQPTRAKASATPSLPLLPPLPPRRPLATDDLPANIPDRALRKSASKSSRWSSASLIGTIRESKSKQQSLQDQLCTYALAGKLDMVREIIQHGADPTKPSKDHKAYCLPLAIRGGSAPTIQYLAQCGASVTAVDPETGLSCLPLAMHLHHQKPEIIRFLIEAGADPSQLYRWEEWSEYESLNAFHLLTRSRYQRTDLSGTARVLASKSAEGLRTYAHYSWLIPAHAIHETVTPLQMACRAHEIIEDGKKKRSLRKLVSTFLELGADVNQDVGYFTYSRSTGVKADNIVHWICMHDSNDLQGTSELLRLLLDKGAQVDRFSKDNVCTALHVASRKNCAEITTLLLEYGASTALQDHQGRTPLHLTTCRKVASLLLNENALIDSLDAQGYSVLEVALTNSASTELLTLLLDHGAALNPPQSKNLRSPLHISCGQLGKSDQLQLLLDRGADIEARDNVGDTALSRANSLGQQDIVRLLLQRGAKTDVVNNKGLNLLTTAVNQGYTELCLLWLESGLDPKFRNTAGETPLHVAAKTKYFEPDIGSALLDHGADMEARNGSGQTPLHSACATSAKMGLPKNEAVHFLVAYGANVNARDASGCTPLHLLCNAAPLKCLPREDIKCLVKNGAEIETHNHHGLTPFGPLLEGSRISAGRKEILAFLKELLLLKDAIEKSAPGSRT